MRRGFSIALLLSGYLACLPALCAQALAGDAQKTPASAPQSSSNPFPDDTSTVPVMPSTPTAASPEETSSGDSNEAVSGRISLPSEDYDPIYSPDDPARTAESGQGEESSSSLKGLDVLLPAPDSDKPDKKRKKEPTHQEAAESDIKVGGYYLEKKNWKAAESRFQSAMVLDPENPEVYWGMAESERHLGEFSAAREHYLKLLDYDPDGPHGKQARKALKDPAMSNALNAVPGKLPVQSPK